MSFSALFEFRPPVVKVSTNGLETKEETQNNNKTFGAVNQTKLVQHSNWNVWCFLPV